MITIPKNKLGKGEHVVLETGRHLLEITSATEEAGENTPYLAVRYRVLAGPSDASQKGEERFYLSEKAIGRLGDFFKRLGLHERGTAFDQDSETYDPAELVGRQVVADIVHETKKREKDQSTYVVSRWGMYDWWSPTDSRVAAFMAQLRSDGNGQPSPPTAEEEGF